VYIGVPTEKEREQILQGLLSSLQIPEKAQLCSKVAQLTPGYVGADLSLLCQDVVFGRCRRKVYTLFLVSTCAENFDLVQQCQSASFPV
jgi:SpoVK/Ycf46/Vps4 family AAA+-type ATPase